MLNIKTELIMAFVKISEQESLYDNLEKKSVHELLTEINQEDQRKDGETAAREATVLFVFHAASIPQTQHQRTAGRARCQ